MRIRIQIRNPGIFNALAIFCYKYLSLPLMVTGSVMCQDGSKPGIVGYQPGAPPEGYNPSLLPTLIPFPPPVISVPPPGYHPMGGAQKRPYDGAGYDVPSKRYRTAPYILIHF